MADISLTNKKPVEIIPEDRSWYKAYCQKCPYFWHEELTEENEGGVVGIRCFQPFGEECLAKSLLVSQMLMVEMHNTMVRKMHRKDEEQDISTGVFTKKRRAKIIKRR